MPTQHQSNAMLANILPASVLSHRVGHTLALTQSQPSYGQLPCIFRMQMCQIVTSSARPSQANITKQDMQA